MYTFSNIIGNEKLINTLKNASKNNTISHAYIIDGAKKSGKELIAKTFAKLLLCEKSDENPCLNCVSCSSFDTLNNPDFFFINTDKKTIGVSDIREKIIKNIETKPFKYKYKVFVIKNAHNMTIQAQNAILKTLEEPPKFAIFILLSQNYNSFLPTILSRCVLLKIKPLSYKLVEQFLITKNIDEYMSRLYSFYSRGSIGVALDIAYSEDFIEFRENVIEDIKNLEKLNLIQMYNLIYKYEQKKEQINDILDIYILTYRDSLIFKETNNFEKVIQKDIKNIIETLSNINLDSLIYKIDSLLKAKMYLKQNANFNMTMECLFLKLKEK